MRQRRVRGDKKGPQATGYPRSTSSSGTNDPVTVQKMPLDANGAMGGIVGHRVRGSEESSYFLDVAGYGEGQGEAHVKAGLSTADTATAPLNAEAMRRRAGFNGRPGSAQRDARVIFPPLLTVKNFIILLLTLSSIHRRQSRRDALTPRHGRVKNENPLPLRSPSRGAGIRSPCGKRTDSAQGAGILLPGRSALQIFIPQAFSANFHGFLSYSRHFPRANDKMVTGFRKPNSFSLPALRGVRSGITRTGGVQPFQSGGKGGIVGKAKYPNL